MNAENTAQRLEQGDQKEYPVDQVVQDAVETSPSSSSISTDDVPASDKGWKAWRVVLASFIYEGIQWGFPLSFGIFQRYFLANDTFPASESSLIPTIGVLSTSILYLGSPLMSIYVEQLPSHRVPLIWFGWVLQLVALVAASFCSSVPQLILTQGFLYSTGDLIVYMPMMSLINEWFISRRGLAYGLVDASTGLTGIAFPFVIDALLARYGWRTTLRSFAVAFFVATLPVLPLLKPRLPAQPTAPFTLRHYWTLFKTPLFHIYSVSNTLQGLAFFLPELFLPTFAASLGLSPTIGAALVAILSAGQFAGQIGFGYISDSGAVSLHLLIFVSSFVSGLAALTLWGLARSVAPLVLYAAAHGIFASALVVLYARMGTALSADGRTQLASYGLFSAQKGLGNILEGPLSSVLWAPGSGGSYALGEYTGVVAFTGGCLVASALVVALWDMGWVWRETGARSTT